MVEKKPPEIAWDKLIILALIMIISLVWYWSIMNYNPTIASFTIESSPNCTLLNDNITVRCVDTVKGVIRIEG